MDAGPALSGEYGTLGYPRLNLCAARLAGKWYRGQARDYQIIANAAGNNTPVCV